MNTCQFRRLQNHRVIGEGGANGNIVSDGSLEKDHLLHHQANVSAYVCRIDLTQVGTIYQYRSVIGLIETGDQARNRGFSRANRPYESHLLSRPDAERGLADRRQFRAGIGESDIFKLDVTDNIGATEKPFSRRPFNRQRMISLRDFNATIA